MAQAGAARSILTHDRLQVDVNCFSQRATGRFQVNSAKTAIPEPLHRITPQQEHEMIRIVQTASITIAAALLAACGSAQTAQPGGPPPPVPVSIAAAGEERV